MKRDGLRGQDKSGGDLRDAGGGTHQEARIRETQTAHSKAQQGADVRGTVSWETVRTLPEGLVRKRKGPLNPHYGRVRG